MKHTTIMDLNREEEVIICARKPTPEPAARWGTP
jgi:hypothetical protein